MSDFTEYLMDEHSTGLDGDPVTCCNTPAVGWDLRRNRDPRQPEVEKRPRCGRCGHQGHWRPSTACG